MLEVVQQEQQTSTPQERLELLEQPARPPAHAAGAPARWHSRPGPGRRSTPAGRSTRRPRTPKLDLSASCTASLVLPTPPGPVSVKQPDRRCLQQLGDLTSARSRPIRGVSGAGRLATARTSTATFPPGVRWRPSAYTAESIPEQSGASPWRLAAPCGSRSVDLDARRREDVPVGAEGVQVLTLDLSCSGVQLETVERVAVVRDLQRSVGAPGRPEQTCPHTGPLRWPSRSSATAASRSAQGPAHELLPILSFSNR